MLVLIVGCSGTRWAGDPACGDFTQFMEAYARSDSLRLANIAFPLHLKYISFTEETKQVIADRSALPAVIVTREGLLIQGDSPLALLGYPTFPTKLNVSFDPKACVHCEVVCTRDGTCAFSGRFEFSRETVLTFMCEKGDWLLNRLEDRSDGVAAQFSPLSY